MSAAEPAAQAAGGAGQRPLSINSMDSNYSANQLEEFPRHLQDTPDIFEALDRSSTRPQTALFETAAAAAAGDDDDDNQQTCRACVESRGECRAQMDLNWIKESGLVCTNRKRVKIKDFSFEVRASMDVEQFVHQAELVLDMKELAIEDIVESMLVKVLEIERVPNRLNQVKEQIFVPGSAILMAHTIQGVSWVADQKRATCSNDLHYDQSWLCALCSLAQISQRHIIIARFKHPTKMGNNANCVRLFTLILTPSKEKSTKNALETGRTFATMLMDTDFRQRLLEAKSETEFKSLMMLQTRQLSKATKGLKNRHKYKLNADIHYSMSSLTNIDNSNTTDAASLRGGPVVGRPKPASGATQMETCVSMIGAVESGGNFDASAGGVDGNNNNNNYDLTRGGFNRNSQSARLFSLIVDSQQTPSVASTPSHLQAAAKLAHCDNKLPTSGATLKNLAKSQQGQQQATARLFNSSSRLCLPQIQPAKGLVSDFRRRIKYYGSDFVDAFVGPPKTIQKTIATVWFLYFGILLPTIAFSALNSTQTHGHMGDLRKAILGQAIGGLVFALLGGQPLVIIMTTAPLCLYTKVIHQMCLDYGFSFPAMYAAVGLWNGFFLTIYSVFGFSQLMRWCTRSTEEIFALFIVIAFITDAFKDLMKNFNNYYYTASCRQGLSLNQTLVNWAANHPSTAAGAKEVYNSSNMDQLVVSGVSQVCRRETSLLFIILMLGTLWLATTLYKFNKTPYLEANNRELLRDYALPTAVIVMSFVGSYVFNDIFVDTFPPLQSIQFEMAKLNNLTWAGVLTSMGLGFTLSLLFFMDQNISAAMVNAPKNGLKKGCAYHFDLLVVGILNGFLTLYGLPMMHGVLPHSPLHVRSLADIEERVEDGLLREVIVNVRETRVTGIVAHILVLASLALIPYPIAYIPTAVLNGLFLYMAVTSLDGLRMFERVLLLFTEQSKYPPNHYIRRCPQRKIHQFTFLQLAQLGVMCLFGFSPYNIVQMFFPVIILLMIPFRFKAVPRFIHQKYLDALDGIHS